MIPNFDSRFTLISTLITLGVAILCAVMRQKEIAEQEAIEAENHKLYTPTEDQQEEEATNLVNTEKASPLQIQKELSTFKFKSDVIMATQFTLLALTAASMVSLCTLPYQILFLL